jgi:hypothetical protein
MSFPPIEVPISVKLLSALGPPVFTRSLINLVIVHCSLPPPPPVALQPLPGLGLLIRFRNLVYTYGRNPWMSDQLIARPLPTQDNTNIE